jgi:hypothetical protein
VNGLVSKRSTKVFGSSASCDTILASSIWSKRPCDQQTTRSASGCNPFLRYVSLPTCPVRTGLKVVAGEGFEPSTFRS